MNKGLVGTWVTRSVSHSIEHYVIAEDGTFLYFNCATRVRKTLAQRVLASRGEVYQCSACAHGARLEKVVEHVAA